MSRIEQSQGLPSIDLDRKRASMADGDKTLKLKKMIERPDNETLVLPQLNNSNNLISQIQSVRFTDSK